MEDSKLLVWHKEELEKDLDMLVKHNISEEDSEDRLSDYVLGELLNRLRNDNAVIRAHFMGSDVKPGWPNNDTSLGLRIGGWAAERIWGLVIIVGLFLASGLFSYFTR